MVLSVKSGTGYNELVAFNAFAQAQDDWTAGASRSGISTVAAHDLPVNSTWQSSRADPAWIGNAIQARATISAGTVTQGTQNATVFATKDITPDEWCLVAHTWFLPSQVGEAGRLTTVAAGGIKIAYFSGSGYGNYIVYPVMGNNSLPVPTGHTATVVKAGYTTGSLATAGTFDPTDVQRIGFYITPTSFSNQFLYSCKVGILKPYVIIGSGSDPMGAFFTQARVTDRVMAIESLGTSYKVRCSLHWHDGSSSAFAPTDTTARTLNFPAAPTSLLKEHFMPDGHLVFKINAGRAADLTGITAPYSIVFGQPQKLQFHYGDSVAPTVAGLLLLVGWSFTGASEATIHAEYDFQDCIFNGCAAVDITDGAVSISGMMTINGGVGAVQMLAEDFTNVDALTFNSVDDTTNNRCIRMSGATRTVNVPPIYTDGSETHVIEYTGAGVLTLNQNAAGVTLTAIATGAGSVVIVSAASWDIIIPGATGTRYRIVDSVDGEIYNDTIAAGPSETITDGSLIAGRTLTVFTTYQSGTTVKWGPVAGWAQIVPTGGGTMDYTVNTPDTKSEFVTWGVDGSTLSELSTDYGNIEAELTPVAAMDYTTANFLAFMAYAMTQADGIRYWYGALTILNAANVRLEIDMVWLNTDLSKPIRLTGNINVDRADGDNPIGQGLSMRAPYTYLMTTGDGPLTGPQETQLAAAAAAAATIEAGTMAGRVTAIKAKTDNLPSDPADASDITASFAAVNVKLDTIDDFIDTEISAIKAKTDSLTFTQAGKVDANTLAVSGTTQTARDLGAQLDATISSRMATFTYTAPDNAGIAAIGLKTVNLPSDPADASDIATATNAIFARLGAPAGASIAADIATRLAAASYTAPPSAATVRDAIFANVTDGALRFDESIRLMGSSILAMLSGAVNNSTGTVTVRDIADTKDRFTWSYDANGNRTAFVIVDKDL